MLSSVVPSSSLLAFYGSLLGSTCPYKRMVGQKLLLFVLVVVVVTGQSFIIVLTYGHVELLYLEGNRM